ncbi:unnamed protein product [Polarella glacialis]|uniref:Uncharacterized protein n=1 Tax=Polarella glacialis TaxID=89957 RepID=A0A813JN75_POLGL|nr:unnamed protein product [Polarella glacialis]
MMTGQCSVRSSLTSCGTVPSSWNLPSRTEASCRWPSSWPSSRSSAACRRRLC